MISTLYFDHKLLQYKTHLSWEKEKRKRKKRTRMPNGPTKTIHKSIKKTKHTKSIKGQLVLLELENEVLVVDDLINML